MIKFFFRRIKHSHIHSLCSININNYFPKIYQITFKTMIVEDKKNKRALEGTKHALFNTSTKIGGSFTETSNPEFLQKRKEVFDRLYEKQKKQIQDSEKKPIKVTLKDGKQVEGIALETTPFTIASNHVKRSLVKDIIVAKVLYSNKVVDFSKGLVDADEDLENPNKETFDFELWDMDRGLEGDCTIDFYYI